MRMSRDIEAQLAGLAVLGEPVRRALYIYVTSNDHDVGRDEAAEALDVPRSVAAFHLDKLVDEGLLAATYRRIGGRTGPGAGRPSKLYGRGPRTFDVTVPPRRYELAARMLAGAIRAGSPVAKAASRSARAYGAALGADARKRAGSRRYRSGSARIAFSSVIRASKAAIRAGSRSSARRSLKFIRRGRLPGNSLVCVAGRDRLVFRAFRRGEPCDSAARCDSMSV